MSNYPPVGLGARRREIEQTDCYTVNVEVDDDGDIALTQVGAREVPDYILLSPEQARRLRDVLVEWLS